MNKTKQSVRVVALFAVLLVAIIVVVTVMNTNAQAALSKQSQTYEATLELTSLDVGLKENDVPVEDDQLKLSKVSENINPGEKYEEVLAAVNTGDQPEYMRVSVRTYWKELADPQNPNSGFVKTTAKDPKLIELYLDGTRIQAPAKDSGWTADAGAQTDEQTVLYSVNPVNSGQALTFADELSINKEILSSVHLKEFETQSANGVIYKTIEYDFNGCKFCVDIEVDAVQTHNAADAIKGAWGVDAKNLGINVGGAA